MEQLSTRFIFDTHNAWINGLIESGIIILVYLGFLAFNKSIIQKIIHLILARLKLSPEKSLLSNFDDVLKRVVLVFVIEFIADSFPLPTKIQLVIQDGLFVALTVLILLFSYDLLDHLGNQLSHKGAAEFKPLFSKLFKTLFGCFALMIVMRHFNYDIWHIVTALGIGSLAVGLAAQPTLSNMIAGFTLLIDRPFRPDDHIQIAGGSEGDVLHIGMRSTWIQTSDGNVLIVPNSELVNSRLVNFNYPDLGIFQKLRFQFDTDAEIKSLKEILRQPAEMVADIIPNSVKVLCSGIIDGRVEITLIYKIAVFSNADSVKDKMIETTLNALKENKISLASQLCYAKLHHHPNP